MLIVVLALAGLGMLVAFRSGARSGHRLARHSQEVTRMGGNLIRALGTAMFIVSRPGRRLPGPGSGVPTHRDTPAPIAGSHGDARSS